MFLALLEIALRILQPAIGQRNERISPFGARYLPHTIAINEREHRVRDRINNVGYHDREFDFDLSPAVRRIGFFGDSFVEAMQVEADSTFASRFEDRARAAGIALDAAAFGISGSGADQSLFRCVHAMHQARFDDVVYVFFWNDFFDGSEESAKPPTWPFLKRGASGARYFSGAFQHDRDRRGFAAGARSVLSRFYLPSLVSYRLFVARTRRNVEASPERPDDARALGLFALGDSIPPGHRAARDHWEDVMRHWRDVARANGTVFRVLYMPGKWETDDSTYAATFGAGGAVPRFGISSWMAAFCEREGIEFLDPTNAFLAASEGRGRDLYWGHLNYAGHRALADFLFDAMAVEAAGAATAPDADEAAARAGAETSAAEAAPR